MRLYLRELKKLISITPGGLVSFISKAYGGSASDRHVVEDCGGVQNQRKICKIKIENHDKVQMQTQ